MFHMEHKVGIYFMNSGIHGMNDVLNTPTPVVGLND